MWLSPVGAAAAAIARRDPSRDEPSAAATAAPDGRTLRAVGEAPYADDVATIVSALAVDRDVLVKARFAAGGSGNRCSPRTPGAVAPLAVGISSTYCATDEAVGGGGFGFSSARAAPPEAAARRNITVTTLPRTREARKGRLRESTGCTTQ
jgi:hypothetical protein